MNYIKILLIGLTCSLFLLSCGGDSNESSEVQIEVCNHFKQYKKCAEQFTEVNFTQCETEYDVQMQIILSKYERIPSKEGYNYLDAKNSLKRCVKRVENSLFEEWKQCLLKFQSRVLDGFQCH